MIVSVKVHAGHQGLHDISAEVSAAVDAANLTEGLCTLFIQHTSASLLVQENCDATARQDLELWLNRLVPEGDSLYTHTLEGADDMPAHIKAALTAVSLSILVIEGRLARGAWQGIFLWEHRHMAGHRTVVVHLS